MQTQIEEAVQKALLDSRQVRITFKAGAIEGLDYLLWMIHQGVISLAESERGMILAVAQADAWGSESNPMVTATLTGKFDASWAEWFAKKMLSNLEAIEAVS